MSATDDTPDRVMAWLGPHPITHTGTWATTRYPETAVEYLRATPAREHAEELAAVLRWLRADLRHHGFPEIGSMISLCNSALDKLHPHQQSVSVSELTPGGLEKLAAEIQAEIDKS